MAGARLTNFGTIFSRATGLLQTGVVKDKPLWYDIYKRFPPELEPMTEREVPEQTPILEIVYKEDFGRVRKRPVETKKARDESLEEFLFKPKLTKT